MRNGSISWYNNCMFYVDAGGTGEYTEKKSRFIGELRKVTSPEEAALFLKETRKAHSDARHHCSAWIIGAGREVKHSNDDGEPSGTAGRPILSVLEGADLTDAALIVTRYFGGVLLGTGGLVRAYTEAAKAAIAASTLICPLPARMGVFVFDYAQWPLVQALLSREQAFLLEADYGEQVATRFVFYDGEDPEQIARAGRIIAGLEAIMKRTDLASEFSPVRLAEAGSEVIVYDETAVRYSL